jgi:hypothetical protein
MEKKYPFKEGDDYWTIENGEIIWSCWDYVSEQLHDSNKQKLYFATYELAKDYSNKNYHQMQNLSVKQQRIISEITSEFQRINQEKESQIKGSLIDINGLLKQQTDDLRLRKEIEAENKLKMQKMYDIVEADMDRLNKDLVHLGLICFYTYENTLNNIAIDTKKHRSSSMYASNNSVRIEYHLPHETMRFESRIAAVCVYQDKPVLKFTYNGPEYKNIEEAAKSDTFINGIKSLLNNR